ncbi:FkbM family methyltransferase [Mesorhizobium sp. M1A.F.Ca.IN.020.03.2.1]|uniref:FkbM family methyltransferase n=1 Tax=unclassified Mesorhizobium TaxID=325217 RepID=UPI000FCBD767|nr:MULTISPECIES: FkbM family methyltransferase [unclassified Mesorhizobium]RUV02487.1 FkbM family methyltransferase [Mesorhizobium sp. M1A.F.Ca.IN.020.03.2.1]RUV89629.1 FkbM family methyltransferase [Mesorhizobium sp. M1A.F.Ca.IN.020.32.1.1]RUW12806.1 FkbM family methyltransferase [Mesorhizobium sp. M1A.F.Ca.IN.022.05.2.1]RWF77843.1 MAG: FkbM family methyltransferase [Mesorhizobium sp.]RWG76608.1 MAG: FkbM family methyltransferase [Mesorhizobium sp.]
MLQESYLEFVLRWHLYRRWHRPPRPKRQAEFDFHQLMKSLPRHGLFIDLGANVGDVTRHALSYGMKVIAFEPDPRALKILKGRFGNDERVTIIPNAVGGSARTAILNQRPDTKNVRMTEWSSLFEVPEHANGPAVEVEVIDLVQFLRGIEEPIAVIKMDIEGAEAECIESMLDNGIYRSIGHVLVETHERLSLDLANRIAVLRDRISRDGINNIDLGWG